MSATDDLGVSRAPRQVVVCLDPGHGGPTSDGACWPPKPVPPKKPPPGADAATLLGYDHATVLYRRELALWRPVLREDDVALAVAKACRLETYRQLPQASPVLTRSEDVALSLTARGALSAVVKPACVVVLHVNAYDKGRAQGAMAFILAHDEPARIMARAILDGMPERLRRKDDDLFVADRMAAEWTDHAQNCLEVHRDWHPVLLEMGFATDPDDRAALTDPAVQAGIASAICAGVGAFLAAGS